MQIQGLQLVGTAHVEAVRVNDKVWRYEVHAIGGGEWSIEATGYDGEVFAEFVGSNGTRDDEVAVDLWAMVRDWENAADGGLRILKPAYSYAMYEAPDGYRGSYSFFRREINAGRLHGCLLMF